MRTVTTLLTLALLAPAALAQDFPLEGAPHRARPDFVFPDPPKHTGPLAARFDAPKVQPHNADLIEVVAESDEFQWTGVAVSKDHRVFVCYPRWFARYNHAVEEIDPATGARTPYPDTEWQVPLAGDDFRQRFICVQALYVDDRDRLWVLDTGAPRFGPIVRPGGAKLVAFDLETNTPVETIIIDADAAPDGTYLNDLRVDTESQIVYITDSGLGALVIVDLKNKTARRVLDRHPSTAAEADFTPVVEGRPLLVVATDEPPVIKADGIALSPDRKTLYWQAISARFTYHADTDTLADARADRRTLADAVRPARFAPITDGILMTPEGHLLFTALEHSAIIARPAQPATPNEHLLLVRDERLAWPDSMALAPDGTLYVTTAQIHRGHPFALPGEFEPQPYRLLRFNLAEALERAEPVGTRPKGL